MDPWPWTATGSGPASPGAFAIAAKALGSTTRRAPTVWSPAMSVDSRKERQPGAPPQVAPRRMHGLCRTEHSVRPRMGSCV